MKYALVLMSVFFAGSAAAGSYSFTDIPENADAENIAVCRDFMENLRRLGNPPLVCDRKFHSASKQFAWPRWRTIDVRTHRDLVEQIWQERYGWAYDENSLHAKANPLAAQGAQRDHALLKNSFENRARRGNLKLAVTQIPIDGTSKDVLRINEGGNVLPCKTERWSSSSPLRQYFVVDHALRRIDFKATEESVLRGYYGYTKDMRPDLFMYEGKPHVASWYENGLGRGHIEVFGDYSNYCFIDFTSTTEGRKQ